MYILLDPQESPLVKIGLTRASTEERARNLFTTGRAVPLFAIWDEYVSDPERVERMLHQRFDDYRVTRRREFFRVAPKEAISALIQIADPYRVHPFRFDSRVNLLKRLHERFGDIFRENLINVELVISPRGVDLVCHETQASGDATQTYTGLGFIYEGTDDDEGPIFDPLLSAEKNARRFLALDEFTLVMCTPLVKEAAAEIIDREQNPFWKEARLRESQVQSSPTAPISDFRPTNLGGNTFDTSNPYEISDEP